MRLWVVWIEGNGLLKACDRLIRTALFLIHITEVIVGNDQIRFKRQRLLILRNRFIQTALFLEREAQVITGLDVTRLESQCLLVVRDRFVQSTPGTAGVA